MNNKILSICIPTYERCDYLRYLLTNIVEQLTKDNLWGLVEVCVSDNGSGDGTTAMVNEYLQKYSNFKYYVQPENLGFDRNILQTASMAEGEYCWFFGSDDKFEEGAIKRIIDVIRDYNGISGITVDVNGYDITMSKIVPSKFGLRNTFVGYDAESIYIPLGIYYGYLSAQVIKKVLWDEVLEKYPVHNYYNAYVHVYIIAQIVKNHPYWVCLSEKLIGGRGENDSFLVKTKDGYYLRLRLEYAYYYIAKDVFGCYSKIYFLHVNQLCDFIFSRLQEMRLYGINIYPLFIEITRRFWIFPRYYLEILPVFILPKPLIRMVHVAKRLLRKIFKL